MGTAEENNLLKIYLMLVDNSSDVLANFFQKYLTDNNLSMEDFIDNHQHNIYHMCYNKRCCKPGCSFPIRHHRNVLKPAQLGVLLDKNIQQSYHNVTTRADEYCCCLSKRGIQPRDLDVTLLNFLLINYCTQVFWDRCCLAIGQNLSGFLETNKHKLFHMTHGTIECCDPTCSATCPLGGNTVLDAHFWHIVFSTRSGVSCGNHSKNNHICINSANVTGRTNLTEKWDTTIQKELCPTRRALDHIVLMRNKYGHLADVTSVSQQEYEKEKAAITDSLCTLARYCGNESETRQRLEDLEQRPLDPCLVQQYQNHLLEQLSFHQDIIEKISSLEDKTEDILRLLEPMIHDRNTQSMIELDEEDDEELLNANGANVSAGIEVGIETAIKCLPLSDWVQPGIGLVCSNAAQVLYKLYKDKQMQTEMNTFILDEKAQEDCSGMIQYYTEAIIILHGTGFGKLTSRELDYVCDKVDALHGVELMGNLWEKVENLKLNKTKRHNFKRLMTLIGSYMRLSFLRDALIVLFCNILQSNGCNKLARGIFALFCYHQNRDRSLLEFLVSPCLNTVTYYVLYKPTEWPVVDKLLKRYFFPDHEEKKLSFLKDGHCLIRSVQFDNSPLYFADIACTWFRWSPAANSQSMVKFEEHKNTDDGKTYFKIFSKKWPDYYANMGQAEWWVRGWTGGPVDLGLWEIVPLETDKFVFSPKDSRALYMTTDMHGRLYGSRCIPSQYELFTIENVFEDASEFQEDEDESKEVFEDAKESLDTMT